MPINTNSYQINPYNTKYTSDFNGEKAFKGQLYTLIFNAFKMQCQFSFQVVMHYLIFR